MISEGAASCHRHAEPGPDQVLRVARGVVRRAAGGDHQLVEASPGARAEAIGKLGNGIAVDASADAQRVRLLADLRLEQASARSSQPRDHGDDLVTVL